MAGNVFARFLGNSFVITGDNAANDITITADDAVPGRFTLTGNATTVNGSPLTQQFQTTGDLRIALAGGDDIVSVAGAAGAADFVPGSLIIDGGVGSNTISVTDYRTGRDLTTINSTGNDQVTVGNTAVGNDLNVIGGTGGVAGTPQSLTIDDGTTVARDVRVTNQSGVNLVTIGAPGAAVAIGRNLSISSLSTVLGEMSTAVVDNTTIGGSATITHRQAGFVSISPTAAVTTGTDLTIRNGNGDNGVLLQSGLGVGGRLTVQNGNGVNVVSLDTVTVGSSTDIRNGDGGATNTFEDVTLGGNLSVYNGNGSNTTGLTSGTVGGNLSVRQGNGAFNSIGLGSTADAVTVAGRTMLTNGNSTTLNLISLDQATLTGGISLTNGNGPATVNISQAGGATDVSTAGGLSIANGSGSTFLAVDDLTVGTDLLVRNGNAGTLGSHFFFAGDALPVAVGRNFSYLAGTGSTFLNLGEVEITGNASLRTGSGDDLIDLGGGVAAGLTVGGSTVIDSGDGDDLLFVGDDPTFVTSLAGWVSIRTGNGNDLLTIGDNIGGGAIDANGSFLFDGGIGMNQLNVPQTVFDVYMTGFYAKVRSFVINVL